MKKSDFQYVVTRIMASAQNRFEYFVTYHEIETMARGYQGEIDGLSLALMIMDSTTNGALKKQCNELSALQYEMIRYDEIQSKLTDYPNGGAR